MSVISWLVSSLHATNMPLENSINKTKQAAFTRTEQSSAGIQQNSAGFSRVHQDPARSTDPQGLPEQKHFLHTKKPTHPTKTITNTCTYLPTHPHTHPTINSSLTHSLRIPRPPMSKRSPAQNGCSCTSAIQKTLRTKTGAAVSPPRGVSII